jgi:superfamily II DNA/RNA helicase
MNGEDVLAIAQTGSGKTAAFAIPIINHIHQYKTSKRSNGVKCLVLAPTRELVQQIGMVFAKLTNHTKVSCYAIYGGVEQDPQIDQLAGGIDVLIATPGRMFDLISQEQLDISKVSVLVLDEADHMLDLGFIDDIESVKRKLKQHHQTLFFSATINPKIKKLAYSQIKSTALRIQVSPEKMVNKNITHSIVKVEMDEKAREKLLATDQVLIQKALKTIENVQDWKKENIESAFNQFMQENNIKLGAIGPAMRALLTGTMQSPAIFDVMSILGKDETLKRLQNK